MCLQCRIHLFSRDAVLKTPVEQVILLTGHVGVVGRLKRRKLALQLIKPLLCLDAFFLDVLLREFVNLQLAPPLFWLRVRWPRRFILTVFRFESQLYPHLLPHCKPGGPYHLEIQPAPAGTLVPRRHLATG